MFKEEGKNGFCVKLLGNLVGAKKWVPKMAVFRKPNRMDIFCPKDHLRVECTLLFPLTLQELKSILKVKIKMHKMNPHKVVRKK